MESGQAAAKSAPRLKLLRKEVLVYGVEQFDGVNCLKSPAKQVRASSRRGAGIVATICRSNMGGTWTVRTITRLVGISIGNLPRGPEGLANALGVRGRMQAESGVAPPLLIPPPPPGVGLVTAAPVPP
jgi:hypothetical protein